MNENKELYLKCHTSGDYVTFGGLYEVIDEDSYEYTVIDDKGDEHFFTKEPDEEGLSYRTWFYLMRK